MTLMSLWAFPEGGGGERGEDDTTGRRLKCDSMVRHDWDGPENSMIYSFIDTNTDSTSN